MKTLFSILTLTLISLTSIRAQVNDTILNFEEEHLETTGQDMPNDYTKESDTSYFTVGEKKIEIIERNDSTYVKVWNENEKDDDKDDSFDFDQNDNDENSFDWGMNDKDKYRFRGHWAGFEFGMNNYVDKDFSLNRNPESEFMDINTNRSWNFNLNFAQYSLPFNSQYIGIVTGMGIEWSNYHFSHSNTIVKNTINQKIEPEVLNHNLTLNRLQTTFLTVPLIIELQFFEARRKDRMYIGAGIIGGIKLGAHTKYNYKEDGNKKKNKDRGDYYLRPFRYAFTGRIGYKLIKVYLNYYPVSLFLDDKGPELYPVAMGFCLTF